ncbi:predicted protein [Scheffersomyces stipitis CBS 6054]|uniref:Inhibitor I9 domain-containing protein n=1 Tax=Scheffersomyces stipitis (strain ATCC 58785 / CBS 6054 / NBRC 10063 / NRRL Y-11545) TaxID=322104 RepID=A3LTI8_PICST|nr:predicted protein [Scheffersomyces stipitis CBS 6054]ABN66419.1 predicted protein [Scheffersomyces stipitis CBS 6054]
MPSSRSLLYLVIAVVTVFLIYTQTCDTTLPAKLTTTAAPVTPVATTSNTSTEMADLKSYIVTLKETISDADYSGLQAKINELGGEVTSQFSLIKGFVAKLPPIHTSAIESHDSVLTIEEDKEVKIQS